MAIYLCNGLSQSMLRDPNMKQISLSLTEREFADIINSADFKSVIGHEDLADALSMVTDAKIKYNRESIKLTLDDYVLLVSLNCRLPEHPRLVDYKGRMIYRFVRFEKATAKDIGLSEAIIREIKGEI